MEKQIQFTPKFDNGDIQTVLKYLGEMFENESKHLIDREEKNGDFYKSQIYAALVSMMQQHIMFNFLPGVGKSCVIIAAILYMYNNSDYYKFTKIATTSGLTESMKYQSLCKCTTGLLNKKGEPNEIFKKKIKIMTHRNLANSLVNQSAEEIFETFKQQRVMIDEFSKMILSDFSSVRKNEDSINYSITPELKRLDDLVRQYKRGEITKLDILDNDDLMKDKKKYIQIWRLSKICPMTSLIGLTGTLITNHPIELFIIGNIFLPLKQQYDLSEVTERIFDNIMKRVLKLEGRIMYLEPAAFTANQVFKGRVIPYTHTIEDLGEYDSKFKLYFSEMYNIQAETMYQLGTRINAKSTNYQIQCYVSSDGRYGNGSYSEEDDYKDEEDYDEEDEDIDDDRVNLEDNLVRMKQASMFSEIMNREKMLFDKSMELPEEERGAGCCFIYNKMVATVNGPLKEIARAYGFKVISGEDLKLDKDYNGTSYCVTDDINIKGISSGKKFKQPTIIFIDGNMKDKRLREKATQIFSSKENVRGRRLQVVVTSKVSEMGYNYGNAERRDFLCSEWSPAVYKQVSYRVLRMDGHQHWIKWMKEHNRDHNPKVLCSNFAPYCVYHWIEADEAKAFKDHTNTFTDDSYEKGGVEYWRFNSEAISYVIGFAPKGSFDKFKIDGKKVLSNELFNFCTQDENPIEVLNKHLVEQGRQPMIKKLTIDDENFEIIYSYCGIVYSLNSMDYDKHKGVFLYKRKTYNFKELSEPCVNDNRLLEDLDYSAITNKGDNIKTVKCRSTLVCHAFAQYMTMERKDIIAKKFQRPLKQIDVGCKSNKERNTLPKEFDYTEMCDYDLCEFQCSNDLKKPKSDYNETVYKDNEIFYDNRDTLFSKDLIDKCKLAIYSKLKEYNSMSLEKLYSLLNDFREGIITKSIIQITGTKCPFLDRFGFQCFVSTNRSHIFVRRVNNDKMTDKEWFEDVNTISGIFSEQSFGLETINKDYEIFEEIDRIKPKEGGKFSPSERVKIIEKIKELKLTSSLSILLERSCLKYKKYKKDKKKNPDAVNDYPSAVEILKIYNLYIFEIEGKKVVINTYPRTTTAISSQNYAKRIENPKEFRVLESPYTEWRDSTPEDLKHYSKDIREYINDILNPELYIRMNDGEDIISPYSIIYDGQYRFSREMDTKTGTSKRNTRVLSSVSVDELNRTIEKIKEEVDLSYYVKKQKKIMKKMGKKFKSYMNVEELVDEYLEEERSSNKDKKEKFKNIFDLLGLVHRIVDEVITED